MESFVNLLLALLAYQNFYSIMLVVPVAICFLQRDVLGLVKYLNPTAVKSILLTLSLTSLARFSPLLLLHPDSVVGFIRSTYGFVIMVPELTPNMGIFWYFFTEVFQHFELFFIIVFQVNAFIYTIPLAIKLRNHSVFLLYTLIVLISIFKSYPTYADVGFYLSFIPCWSFTHKYMKNVFIVSNMYIWCAALSPVFYHLWIYAGSANANFYFALTLVFNGAQIFFISDLILAYLRRDFDLHHLCQLLTLIKLNSPPHRKLMMSYLVSTSC
ncbi:PIGU [Bugula neritina]|uniref:PIGU n=1 Tax=Bugula neritina TaxID=10212 RepID=A0A7J7KMV9_BUGNE|nr:PIGU [Bugula neritina]